MDDQRRSCDRGGQHPPPLVSPSSPSTLAGIADPLLCGVFSFNEPDLSSQANVDPTTAANLWMTYMQPFAGQATLVGPSITNGGAPVGTAWLDQFMDECNTLGCQVDAIAGHIYASAYDPDYYKTYIADLGTRYGKPVVMTEIGVDDSSTPVEDQVALINELVPFLDGLDSVSHYAWFMAAPGFLVNADGSLTALGEAYNDA